RKHAQLINIIQRVTDIFILLIITWLVSKKYGSNELNKVFAIYGSLLMKEKSHLYWKNMV
ncbi:hypothetical protein, partial [Desulfobacterium sp. N47]